MPNWCSNTMTLSHPDPAMLEKAAAAWDSGKFLETMIPCPTETTDWYGWRLANWGTKWDIGKESELSNAAEIEGQSFSVSFCSAWSPPTFAYQKLEEMGYAVIAYYFEPGMDFCGKYAHGVDEYCRVDERTEEIDEAMGISESIAVWEAE